MPEGFMKQPDKTPAPTQPPRILNPSKALRTLRKTPTLLAALLRGASAAQLASATDGPGGWTVVDVIAHMRDLENAYQDRVRLMLAQTHPTFVVVSNEELTAQNATLSRNVGDVVAEYTRRRQAFIALLEGLTDAQWQRTGVHPQQGEATVLDVAINTGLHDVDHLEQLARILASST